MQFPFDFPFSTPTSMCSQLTQIAVPPWRIFPFHQGDDYLRSTSCYFSSAVKCSTKAQRHSDMIDRSFVKSADAIYLEEDGGLQQYDFSSINYVSFRGTLPNLSKTIVDPKPRKFIATKDSAVSPSYGQNQDFASQL
ncbi:hypothetical protein G5I_02026 [Acromyrmex echinatior]|uniref:Uncharacterized protein n=1 Tax=Acromyrmex echinatior TaxID=103372 RepID=F4W979_ACREC|nr:hypothetical protein G5I_02026 [Acromyrmex echinatior]